MECSESFLLFRVWGNGVGREEGQFGIEIEKTSWLDLILLVEMKYKMEANGEREGKESSVSSASKSSGKLLIGFLEAHLG
jgi:hypothetical protein